MKKLFLILVLTTLLSSCNAGVGGGFGVSNGGAGISLGAGLGF
ncbi:lipoprotein [Actinobacillus porcinus]|nr:lipoprotein [Actinobacillus porcinus]MDY6215233.1 lipoprotein [Actinobacillus porcinus]